VPATAHEDAFIQVMRWLTMAELVRHPTTGMLLTHAPRPYEIPTADDCRADFRVALWNGENAEDTIRRSEAVDEPPLLRPFSMFIAIRDAVSAVAGHRVDPPLSAPATPAAILRRGDVGFLGLIGLETERAHFLHRFEVRGIPADALGRMTCAIGPPSFPGKEPEVLAASLVAQLLAWSGGPPSAR
jgi:xanthine/CO dehydrogenase XdhC/CoxF family maturation factor